LVCGDLMSEYRDAERLVGVAVVEASLANHSSEYSKLGNILSPSFVPLSHSRDVTTFQAPGLLEQHAGDHRLAVRGFVHLARAGRRLGGKVGIQGSMKPSVRTRRASIRIKSPLASGGWSRHNAAERPQARAPRHFRVQDA
jgi:hypothetical protein